MLAYESAVAGCPGKRYRHQGSRVCRRGLQRRHRGDAFQTARVAYLGAVLLCSGTTVAPIEAFATAKTAKSGRTFYHSQIIARKDSGIKDINDLKGKDFAFVDPSSTSGHLFPKAGLIKLGIDPENFFGRVLFTGSHDANALAVANERGRCSDHRRPHSRCPPYRRIWSSARTSRWCGALIRSRSRRPFGARTMSAGTQGEDQDRVLEMQRHHLGRPGQTQPLRRDQ